MEDHVSQELLDAIYDDLNKSDMLNIFGLVNISALRARVHGLEPYTDEQVQGFVKELFDDEVINGVQFLNRNR